jgi:hypothetical protein
VDVFGMAGIALGALGLIFGSSAMAKIAKLEKQLRDAGLLK